MLHFNYFPWRFFWRSFLGQLAVFYSLTLVFLFVFFFFEISDLNMPLSEILLGAGLLFLSLGLASFWFAYRLSTHFGRVVIKARRLSGKKFARNYSPDEQELFEEEMGEFVELERALSRIRRKLKRRKDQLAVEQEEADALMASIGDAVVRVDCNEQISFFNSQFSARFLEPEQLEHPPMLAEVFREPTLLEAFHLGLTKGERQETGALRVVHKENDERFYSVTVNPLRTRKSKEIYGALGTLHDITELKRAELIRIEFVANASHELRTPLTSLKGYVDTLATDIQEQSYESAGQFVQVISRNVNRLIDLVNDLLTISNLESQDELDKDFIDVRVLTENILRQFVVQAQEKEIQIKSDYEVDQVFGDARRIEQVIINLVSNAIKYVPAQREIKLLWTEGDQGVRLHVKDNGPGIAKEHLPRLFERFYRVDRGRSRDAGGTGLGLAIVKHIMHSHGGRVQARSRLGEGAEFICTFPHKTS